MRCDVHFIQNAKRVIRILNLEKVCQEKSNAIHPKIAPMPFSMRMPAYIKISVSKETLDWWDVVTSKKHDISVSLKVTGFDGETGDGEYTYKSEVNNTMRKMAATIKAAWTLLEED